jgi:hypothetical protein
MARAFLEIVWVLRAGEEREKRLEGFEKKEKRRGKKRESGRR